MSDLKLTKNRLDEVSSSFCLAKWTSLSLHLESGLTHSCHHPAAHKIPLNELTNNPAALHNTSLKIKTRDEMMKGKKTKECDYCWNIEALNTNEVSDRILKSSYSWAVPYLDQIKADPLSKTFKPAYLEVSFSHVCQMRCSYCSANFSTKWEEDIKANGPYHRHAGGKTTETFHEDSNPYIEAFWKWWPDIKSTLHTFRITGGEPLLSKNTFGVLESLEADPQPHKNLAINSNLCVPTPLVHKLIENAQHFEFGKNIKRFDLFTSIDAFGEKAEYIRNGFKHDLFWKHVDEVLTQLPQTSLTFMSTFNALSITSYIELLEKIKEVNLKHRNSTRRLPVLLDIAYLRHPDYQTVKILPAEYIPKMQKIVEFIQNNQQQQVPQGLTELQIVKAKRIYEWMKEELPASEKKDRQKDFFKFFSQHDSRRNTNFLKTFPEMGSFWSDCKNL